MLDVHRLRVLRELALRGTIAATAQALGYTPSAVSQQLSTLEREAGRTLLARTGRSVQLTEAGRVLVEHANSVLGALESARVALDALDDQVTGELRIGAFGSAMRSVITPALVHLSAHHPALRVRVTEIDPATAPDLVRCGDLDAALLQRYDNLAAIATPALDTEPLFDEVVYLAVHRDHHVELVDCADATWISGTAGTMCDDATVRTCENAGFVPRVRHRTDDFSAVLALVAAGQGVALVPQLATVDVPDGVHVRALPLRRHTSLAYRRGAARDPLVGAARAALSAGRAMP